MSFSSIVIEINKNKEFKNQIHFKVIFKNLNIIINFKYV